MAETQIAIAEQFDDPVQQKIASTFGMWTFLATEVLFFGAVFLAYIVYRSTYPNAFAEAGKHTILLFGSINAAILLTSSFTMALAVHAVQNNNIKWLLRLLLITILLGCAFLAVKGLEYHEDVKEQLFPGPNFKPGLPYQAQIFWFLYWVLTGWHTVHLAVGIGLLSVITFFSWQGKYCERYYNPVFISGLYWHFVDLVWIWLYPLLYLVNRHS